MVGVDGRLLFAKYALMPNRLGYCGGPLADELFDYVIEGRSDDGTDRLITQFEAAYPYLKFIASSTGIGDPVDPRVVEAYWIGGSLLDQVDDVEFHTYLSETVARKIPKRLQKYVIPKAEMGSRVNHAFHVFDVSVRNGAFDHDLTSMDLCRISWGTVVSVNAGEATVLRQPLEYFDGSLKLGSPVSRNVRYVAGGKSYLGELIPGDTVSMHWDWVCDRVSADQVNRLQAETIHHLVLANTTL